MSAHFEHHGRLRYDTIRIPCIAKSNQTWKPGAGALNVSYSYLPHILFLISILLLCMRLFRNELLSWVGGWASIDESP